ncbi:MAG: DNA gyrase subunit A [Burkholderiales bacterium]|nr:DNA gyrase subunit A [Burkholderiales bacterium]
MDSFAKETLPISLEQEMRTSYLDYAMSVIVGRALPDVRDGLKPVHRRVLFGMHEANNTHSRPYVKCARIVGDVMGKFHPHGDSAIYDTLVRMAQDFSLRYTLIDGQGNFGSIDGDNAAAMRYTECRLQKISAEMLGDLDKETVDFQPNYDGKEQEPTVLPTKFPNLLVNGSAGIAVGMATNIPPHNLVEVIDATLALLKKPDIAIDELIKLVPAPDFPTGGFIYGLEGVHQGYRTGRGRVVMRARTHFEPIGKTDRQAIIVDEIPYQVNKSNLLQKIGEMVRDKRVEGISDLRDESDKSGMRIVIELKRGEIPDIVLNNLYKNTQLEDSFGMNMVALVDNRPRILNLKDFLEQFVLHRREVVTRRTQYELRQARARGHILEGLAVALANVDPIIELIKASATPEAAQTALTTTLWRSELVAEMVARADADFLRPAGVGPEFCWQPKERAYRLTDVQAKAILEMRLQRLTAMESDKVITEYKDVIETVRDLLDILAKPERVTRIIAGELADIRKQFGDARRSEIVFNAEETSIEDLIKPQDMVVTLTHSGYFKAQPVEEYRAQKRGGRGKQATATKEEDFVEKLFIANTHDYILCFSNRGRVYWLKVYEVPEGGRNSRGKPIVNLFPLQDREKITAIVSTKDFDPEKYIFMATSKGTVKKTSLEDFSRPKKTGIIAVDLDDGDYLIGAALTDGKHDVMLFSDGGKAVRFDENDVRSMGRNARGVRGMMLEKDQRIIAMLVAEGEELQVLTATENGFGKRTPIIEYTRHGRGTKGMIAIQQSARNGKVVAATLVNPGDEVMLITTGGVLIRTTVKSIRESGRSTQGVTLIKLDDGVKLSGIERIDEPDVEPGVGDQGELI